MRERPSWSSGFARSADESEAPWQWDRLIGAWTPFLGHQGGTAFDLTGRAQHAALTGVTLASGWQIGQNGLYVQLNGSSGYMHVPVLNVSPSPDFTWLMWIRTSSAAESFIVTLNRNPANFDNMFIARMTTAGVLRFFDRSTVDGFSDITTSNTSFNNGVWHQIGFTRQGTAGVYYLDGRADGTKTAAVQVTYGVADLVMGKNIRDGGLFLNGGIAEFRLYARALAQKEVAEIYADPFAMYRLRPQPVWCGVEAAVSLIAQERSIMRRVSGRVFGRVN